MASSEIVVRFSTADLDQIMERDFPAVVALARFGADVVASHRARDGRWVQPALLALPDIARDTGVTVDGQLAPGIREAVDRLIDRGGE